MDDDPLSKKPAQVMAELEAFVNLVKAENVCSYLEIGSQYGGSFWHVVRAMPKGSLAVSVDLPKAKYRSQPYLLQCVEDLRAEGYDAHSIIGDSANKDVVELARKHAPYDLCLIDGNHNESFIRSDWANYGPMARIVAFHDISCNPTRFAARQNKMEVAKVWDEIKTRYRHQEIRLSPTPDNGFGVLWR